MQYSRHTMQSRASGKTRAVAKGEKGQSGRFLGSVSACLFFSDHPSQSDRGGQVGHTASSVVSVSLSFSLSLSLLDTANFQSPACPQQNSVPPGHRLPGAFHKCRWQRLHFISPRLSHLRSQPPGS